MGLVWHWTWVVYSQNVKKHLTRTSLTLNRQLCLVFYVLLGELPRIDSMKEFLRYMRKSREKFAMQHRSRKTNEKASLVKFMVTSVVDFLTEGMKSFCTSPCQDGMPNKDTEHSTQTYTSPATVVAAMGNQQLRGQVSIHVVVFVVTDVHSVHLSNWSVFLPSVLLLIMNFFITLSK